MDRCHMRILTQTRLLPLPALLALLGIGLQGAVAQDPDHAKQMAQGLKLFTGQVRAILNEHCVRCHGGEKTRSDFDLTTRRGLLAGGELGIAVVPGQPAESPLLAHLRHAEKPFMPLKKPQLAKASITAIGEWISLGAAYDAPLAKKGGEPGAMQVTDTDRAYWAFAPLKRDFPAGAGVNHFVKAGEPASPRVLARRLHFDLAGLPPAPQEVDKFVNNTSPGAHEKLVDRLLDSRQFGERWARHWLDIARFAESHGFEQDYDRKFAFHYRDF
ncbi:MAG: DUF1549 domain-containing protein, partial [Verrucomicrobiales bacterium]